MIKLNKYRTVKYTQKNGIEVFFLQRRSMLVFWNNVGNPEHCLEHAKQHLERQLKQDLEMKETKFVKEEIVKF